MKRIYPIGEAPPVGEVPTHMYAWTIRPERYGEPALAYVLEEVEVPEPADDEVLVWVMAAGINYNGVWAALGEPMDVIAARRARGEQGADFHICGSDASGIVYRVGRGVTSVRVGDEVAVHGAQWSADCPTVRAGLDPVLSPTFRAWGYETSWGSFAQFAKVQAHQCLPKPERLTWEEAACYLAAGASAHRMLHMFDPVRPGDAVLVWGAAGGLGSMAVQLARLAGARPVAVIGSGARREFCLDLGAVGCVERNQFRHWGALPDCDDEAAYEGWLKGVRAFGRAVWEALGTRDNPRLVIEHPGEDTIPSSLFVCAPGGMVVTCGGTSGYNGSLDLRYLWIRQKRLQGSHGFDDHQAGAVNELVARGLIRPGLSRAFGFDELPLALQLMYENRHPPGNMAVLVSSPALGLGVKDSRRARATALTAGSAGWKVRSGRLRSLAITGAVERPEDGTEITVTSLVEENGFREALGVSVRAAECAWSALEDAGRDPLDRKDLRVRVADPEDSLTRLAEACREIEDGAADTALLVSEGPLGAVALVVRRLEDARRDGDPVRAVLRVLETPGHGCAGLDSVVRAAATLGQAREPRLLEVAGPGGSRAVLEEVLPEPESHNAPGARLLTLSARTPAALDAAAQRLADHLDDHPDTPLDGAAFTLQTGRPRLARRRAVVCRDGGDAVKALREPSRYLDGRGETIEGRPVVFLLPGGGVQYPGMSRGLYRSEPAFRQEIDRCAELLQPSLGLDLRTLLYPSDEETERARQELARPAIFLPALFAVEYAQARLWMSWGVRPAAMIGHSFGEYVAACLAGVFSLADALALVAYRGELFKTLPGGAMLTVSLAEEELVRRLPGDLALAVVNGPALCVLSGPGESVRAFAAELAAEGVEHKLLPVAGASHTPMVAPILPALTRFVEGLERRPPRIPYISNVTGTWITADQAMDPEYWALHSRSTVRFSHGLAEVLAEPGRLLLEVGPGKTLSSLARLQGAADVVSSIRHPNDPVADEDFLLAALGRLWAAGVSMDWDALHRGERPRRVSLPSYPFGLEVGPEAGQPIGEELGDIEGSLAVFFRELLGVETVRKTDSFFDLGGHSLLGTRLLSRVREALGVELPLRKLFEAPTLGALAASVEAARGEGADDGPPVAPVPRDGLLPLSFAQQRLWFVDQMEPGNPFYNLPLAWSLEGPLSIPALAGALTGVVRRHEALRTAFPSVDGQPHQAVLPAVPVTLPVVDLSALPQEVRHAEIRRLAAEHVARPFHLDRGPLFQALLLSSGPESHALVVAVHHIVFDRWSLGVFSRELRALYAGSPLPGLAVQYADYASWLRDRMSGGRLEEQLSWWKDRLTGLEPLDLPGDRPRPPVQSFRGARLPVELPEELTPALQTLARQQGATPFMVLAAAYQALLARWAGRHDIAVGTPIAGRIRAELEPLVGFFINTLVLRADLSGGPTFREHLRRVRETVLGAYAHQEIPFERLIEELQPARDLSRNALFEAVFAFQNVPTAGLELPGLAVAPLEVESRSAKTDLALFLWQDGDRLKGYLEYALDLFDGPTPGRLASQLARLLQEACLDPGLPVADLRLLGTHEEQQILREWGGGPAPFPGDRGVHELFSAMAASRPETVALSWDGGEWTYAELERRAEALARRLRARGVGLESRVAVLVERSPELIAGQLAVLKAGGAYVPLDPGLPEERLRFLLSDTGIVTAVARPEMKDRLAAWGVEVVDPGSEEADEDVPAGGLPTAGAGDLAYIMFTSGSTGVPKGVAVTHRNILRLVFGQTYARMGPDEVMIQLAPVSFDAATFEVWGCLLHGGRLAIGPVQPPTLDELSALLRRHGVTTLWLTTGLFNQVVDHAPEALSGLREILTGGDLASVPHMRRALEALSPGSRLVHFYGPTEVTTFTTSHPMEKGESLDGPVPIGRPIANTETYVLDEGLKAVPQGIPGELYLGGDGVARGYWSRPALTAERFVPHPFPHKPGERLYRTGDLVRWRADGRLEFLGRVDRQVKIRGFRIEPGEIESVLLQVEGVQEAAVLAKADPSGDKTLVAFVVPEPGRSLETRALREALGHALPTYFVPGAFVILPELPLSRTGKIDRRELLRLAETVAETAIGYVVPRGPVEEALAGLFGTLLGRGRVSADDDFFELGGHSLLAIQLTARLRDAFGVDLPLRALFEEPTLAALAARIERELPEAGPDADRISRQPRQDRSLEGGDVFPLSFPQERLWSASRLPGSESLFNVARGFRLAGPLNEQVLQEALALVAGRHEALRTTFAHEGGRPIQRVSAAAGFELEVTDLVWMPETERREEALRLAVEDARQPFDLQRGPLFRARLLRLGEEERWLVLTLHHIVIDGWSMGVLYRELGAAFEALGEGRLPELPELPVQYPDFAVWQRERRGPELEAQVDWWRERLAGVPVLDLPADRPRPVVQSVRGGVASLPVGPELAAALQALGRPEGASLFMIVLAALQTLLTRYTGRTDLSVGSPVAGRLRPEVEGLVGFFVNLLVFRADLSGDPSFRELLAQVRESVLDAFAHQEAPFERLVEALQPRRNPGQNPLFQVHLAVQTTGEERLRLASVEAEPLELRGAVAQWDVALVLEEREHGFDLIANYKADLFDRATIDRLLGHARNLLASAAADPGRRISELRLLGEAEEREILLDWNRTEREIPGNLPAHRLFEARAAEAPGAPALLFGDAVVTYGELEARSNRVARHLRRLGVRLEDRVGLCLDRGPDLIAAMLAVQKAGGAYVALDPAYPADRLGYILADSGIQVLVSSGDLADGLPERPELTLLLDLAEKEIGLESPLALEDGPGPDNLAYVIYTSGSTGRPKGVLLAHRGLTNLGGVQQGDYEVTRGSRLLQFASASFDASVSEIYTALAGGAALCLGTREELMPGPSLTRLLREREVTAAILPPSALAMLDPADVPALRTLVVAGEACPPELARRWSGAGRRFVNAYGPTEVTVCATHADCSPDLPEGERPPIGRPLANARVYVTDPMSQTLPVGVPGELRVSGIGLARGYHGRPDLTAERFVPDPFGAEPGGRLYRTGDLVRWRTDGQLDFLGRIDQQVKLRGFRIEPGEIEAALRGYPLVSEAAVVLRELRSGEMGLVAYVVGDVEEQELRGHLRDRLPEHMVPAAFVALAALPLSPNGKVDRRALPDPREAAPARAESVQAPATSLERTVAEVWAGILGRDVAEIGLHDNFFDIGGHSLALVEVFQKLVEILGRDLPLMDLFENPTVASLAAQFGGDSADPAHDVDDLVERQRSAMSARPAWRMEEETFDE